MKSPDILMDTDHGITFAELYDYFLEQCDKETAGRVEFHLADCAECRELLRVMALLSGASPEEVAPPKGDHPLLQELVSYYRNPALLSPIVVKRIESHLATCADCCGELDFLRELEDDMSQALPPGGDES